jgi:hypothetical protein
VSLAFAGATLRSCSATKSGPQRFISSEPALALPDQVKSHCLTW